MIGYFGGMVAFTESISAGFPSAAEGYEDEALDLHRWLVRNPAATFFYRVRGDELRAEHVRDGAVLVVDRSMIPIRGRLVVAEQHGEFVVARYKPFQPWRICGVVVGVVMRI